MRGDRYLNISSVTKSYPNPFGDEVAVVNDFDLTISKGEVIPIYLILILHGVAMSF